MKKLEEYPEITDDLVKYIAGSANFDERKKAKIWIAQNEQNRKYFDELKDVHEASVVSATGSDFNSDTSWERVKSRFYKRKSERLLNRQQENKQRDLKNQWFRIAAIFILAFTLGGFLIYYISDYRIKQQPVVFNEVLTPFGSRSSLVLADGTKVWLNAGSKLSYPVNFSEASRDVYLEGEAYFDVKKMTKKKFIVHASNININVLGTEFNVTAYPGEKTIQTTLVRGRIIIEGAGKWYSAIQSTELNPNQTATYIKNLNTLVTKNSEIEKKTQKIKAVNKEIKQLTITAKIDPIVYTSWKDHKWFIVSEELQSLATKLERRYDVKIIFTNESLKNYKFTGTLTDETLQQVLNIIKITSPIEYEIVNKNVTFKINTKSKKSYDELLINR